MLKFPIHGFAKRVDDTVVRAMAFLRDRDGEGFKGQPPASAPKIGKKSLDDRRG